MRTTKELLIILRDNIELSTINGLCFLNITLLYKNIITDAEHTIIHDYIYNNQPSKKSKLYGGSDNGFYYWPKGEKEPRLRWLKYHIRINK